VVVGLGIGARKAILEKIVGQLPVNMVEVVPKAVSLGLFEVASSSLFGGHDLNAKTLANLARLDGVAAAYQKIEVDLPLGARGGARIFGHALYTDLFMTALPAEVITPEVPDFSDHADFIPVVISNQLIEIYNSSVAPMLGTPRLTADTLKGFEFDVVVGHSMMLGSRGASRTGHERARIVGASRYAMRLGVTVPLATADRLLAKYGTKNSREYSAILLRAESPEEVPSITRAVKEAGLAVDETAQRTSDILTAVTLLAALVGLLVLALAALNIAHSFFASLSEQRRDLAILRALGAGQRDLILLVTAQALWLGMTGGIAGVALAHVVTGLIDTGAHWWLPDFPFKPESFFSLPLWLSGGALVAAMLASVAGALWPAVRAARSSLVAALSDV